LIVSCHFACYILNSQSQIRRLIPVLFNPHCDTEGSRTKSSASGLSDRGSHSGQFGADALAVGRTKSSAPRESRAESPAIIARLAAVRGSPAGAPSAASRTAGPSLPLLRLFSPNLYSGPSSPREIIPHQTTATFTQRAVEFAEPPFIGTAKEPAELLWVELVAHAGSSEWPFTESLSLAGVCSPPGQRSRASRDRGLRLRLRRPYDRTTKGE
jgi:hypothetical protein